MNDNKPKSTDSVVKHSLRFEETSDDTRTIVPSQSIVFSNWFLFKKQIEQIGSENGKNVILDLSETITVDHKVLNKLREMQSEFIIKGLYLKITLTKKHHKWSKRPFTESKKGLKSKRRITIIADPSLQAMIEEELKNLGAIDFTSTDCVDLGTVVNKRLRIEVLTLPDISNRIIKYIQEKLIPDHAEKNEVRAYKEDV